MEFSIKDFFSKCDQIRRTLPIWLYLLKKSLMENLIFCAVIAMKVTGLDICDGRFNTVEDHDIYM